MWNALFCNIAERGIITVELNRFAVATTPDHFLQDWVS
jgi:hypothetical protein